MQRQYAIAPYLQNAAFVLAALIPLALVFLRPAADAALSLAGLLFLVHSALARDWEWLRWPFTRIALGLWLVISLIISPFAVEMFASYQRALPWVRFPLFFIACTYWILPDRLRLRRLCLWQALLLALIAADTFVQYMTGLSLTGHPVGIVPEGGIRLTGAFETAKVGIFLSKISIPILGFLTYLALKSGKKKQAAGWIALLLALCVLVLLSGERTAFFCFLMGLSAIGGVLMLKERRARIAVPLLAVLLLGVSFLLYKTQASVQERTAMLQENVSDISRSPYGILAKTALAIGMQHPLTGAGLSGFRRSCERAIAPEDAVQCINLHPHNPYFEWFADAGFLGLAGFLLLIGSLFIAAFRAFRTSCGIDSMLPALAAAAWLSGFFPLMASQSQFSNWPGVLLWYALSLAYTPIATYLRPK